MATYPSPTGGASLLLSFRLPRQVIVIIGSNTLAAARAFSALEADSDVVILSKGGRPAACDELRWRAEHGQLRILDMDTMPCSAQDVADRDASALEQYLAESRHVRFVCVTDTVLGMDPPLRRSNTSVQLIVRACSNRNIPVNVTDMPEYCDFSFLSTHRFVDAKTGAPSSLQVGITTNGQGCRLASRLRRDIVAKLHKEVGGAVVNVGKMRDMVRKASDVQDEVGAAELSEDAWPSTPNQPVPQRTTSENAEEEARRRMKWVAQVSEYWPIPRLAKMTKEDMSMVLDGRALAGPTVASSSTASDGAASSLHGLALCPPARQGRIFLVGSGPGHPSLLTMATHAALTKHADLVLSDKLVPAPVLAIIPPEVEVRIARKFPGNADGAQAELMEAAVKAARRGLTVVRLKQGDPSVYGRAGEEVLYFREHGFEPVVVPGVSSVLAGPTLAGIPVTQRGAAESFVVCTGVGRQGKEVKLPGYERSRSLVILMGVARLPQIIETLLADSGEPTSRRNGPAYPPCVPIAIIERASMPDQRVIYSTLQDIATALESGGEQRPPGMMIVGWSVLSLWEKGDVSVLDDGAAERDVSRLTSWLGDRRWRIVEGLDAAWEDW
ncbi:hypothetical protein POSPLADRAFT_1164440 [Postia placenta MAD-698-R-SB12]|uniref:precorrin-2 dehydrogenase n=1 Tax=Postia placenta MAD-698-R-SB12 TaxID=670580 RepID=A0A1X6NFM4_9APHY|nr:hypothetical protein POSPLADRAFT_1164440 [Postia placenta MAD-698-R-SB12]OSX67153.1 hypothetical protein POSPLADRAFT_1164440 [Postia placenta MAD-698-R-SB12]